MRDAFIEGYLTAVGAAGPLARRQATPADRKEAEGAWDYWYAFGEGWKIVYRLARLEIH